MNRNMKFDFQLRIILGRYYVSFIIVLAVLCDLNYKNSIFDTIFLKMCSKDLPLGHCPRLVGWFSFTNKFNLATLLDCFLSRMLVRS